MLVMVRAPRRGDGRAGPAGGIQPLTGPHLQPPHALTFQAHETINPLYCVKQITCNLKQHNCASEHTCSYPWAPAHAVPAVQNSHPTLLGPRSFFRPELALTPRGGLPTPGGRRVLAPFGLLCFRICLPPPPPRRALQEARNSASRSD